MVSHLEKPYGSHEHGGQTHCGHPRLRLMICPQTREWCSSQGGKRAGEAQRGAGLCPRGPTTGPPSSGTVCRARPHTEGLGTFALRLGRHCKVNTDHVASSHHLASLC